MVYVGETTVLNTLNFYSAGDGLTAQENWKGKNFDYNKYNFLR